MFKTSLITTQKKWPSFLKNSPLTKIKTIEKSFSAFGLDDCRADAPEMSVILYGKDGVCKYIGALKIVFSTHPWDIATMSMRGITSCQRWSGGEYKHRLVGTMVDPYAGIIYLTDGRAYRRGERMFARAVVRITADRITGKPSIFLERIYVNSGVRQPGIFSDAAATKFLNFIQSKLPKDIVVDRLCYGEIIPMSKIVQKLSKKYKSYRDSGIAYNSSVMFKKHLKIMMFKKHLKIIKKARSE